MNIDPEALSQLLGGLIAVVALLRGKKYVDQKAAATGAVLERARELCRAAARPFLKYVNVQDEDKIRAQLFAVIDKIADRLRITLTPAQRAELESAMEQEILIASFEKLGNDLDKSGLKRS